MYLIRGLLLPLVEELGDRGGLHVSHVGELVALREDDFAVVVEDGESRDAVEVYAAAFGDVEVGVDAADVDVDLDEVFGEEIGVGLLVEVDVENLTVAAPVAAEIYKDTLVSASGFGDAGFEVFVGVGDGGIEIFLDRRGHGHGNAGGISDGHWSGRDSGCGRRRFFAAGDEECGCEKNDCDGGTGLADEVRRSHVRLLEVHRSSSAKCAVGCKGGLSGDTPLRGV